MLRYLLTSYLAYCTLRYYSNQDGVAALQNPFVFSDKGAEMFIEKILKSKILDIVFILFMSAGIALTLSTFVVQRVNACQGGSGCNPPINCHFGNPCITTEAFCLGDCGSGKTCVYEQGVCDDPIFPNTCNCTVCYPTPPFCE